MILDKLEVRGFRCFDRFTLHLSPSCTLIVGSNGSGKSSLLEALAVTSSLRSFRTASLRELIAFNAEAFSLKLFTTHPHCIEVAYGLQDRRTVLDGISPLTRDMLLKTVSVISMTENDLDLLQGLPEGRRNFLDYVASTLYPESIPALKEWAQVLRLRNALLSSSSGWHRDTYLILTERIWPLHEMVRSSRKAALSVLEKNIAPLFAEVAPGYSLSASYKPYNRAVACSASVWCAEFVSEERARGRSLCGAQLDDFVLSVDGHQARRFASRGMQKLLVLLLKVAHAGALPSSSLLLDDLFSDFDEERMGLIIGLLERLKRQLVITVPCVKNFSDAYLQLHASVVRLDKR